MGKWRRYSRDTDPVVRNPTENGDKVGMVFSSLVFLCGFLPPVLAVYYLCPERFRNFFLFLASLLFYAWGEPVYILIMLFSTVFDYCNARAMEALDKAGRQRARKGILILSVVGNIGILSFFKYTDFVLETVNQLTGSGIELLKLALPIGISFYTFQTLSYSIDVYRRRVPVQKNIISFGMYVCLFPQLIAGPIVRYADIQDQIANRSVCWQSRAKGMQRFLIGLGKKVLLANQIGRLWDEISALPAADLCMTSAWLGALAFSFQIYFDFSGYSDMAIGLGQLLGFSFPENFRYPYESKSITEFWRRWHITLGTWFREYVYIPLGGNRQGIIRQIFNLLVVWFLTGLWHGAGWNFILWGLYFFVLLLAEKLFLLQEMEQWPRLLRHVYALFFIVLGWAIFACDDMRVLLRYIGTMFGSGTAIHNEISSYYWSSNIILLLILAVGSLQLPAKLAERLCRRANESMQFAAKSVFVVFVLFLSIAFLVSGSYNPFLYFRF